jgi:hypothetical protein
MSADLLPREPPFLRWIAWRPEAISWTGFSPAGEAGPPTAALNEPDEDPRDPVSTGHHRRGRARR